MDGQGRANGRDRRFRGSGPEAVVASSNLAAIPLCRLIGVIVEFFVAFDSLRGVYSLTCSSLEAIRRYARALVHFSKQRKTRRFKERIVDKRELIVPKKKVDTPFDDDY